MLGEKCMNDGRRYLHKKTYRLFAMKQTWVLRLRQLMGDSVLLAYPERYVFFRHAA